MGGGDSHSLAFVVWAIGGWARGAKLDGDRHRIMQKLYEYDRHPEPRRRA